jgi:4'-phosphopantetheinyl transferase EntD
VEFVVDGDFAFLVVFDGDLVAGTYRLGESLPLAPGLFFSKNTSLFKAFYPTNYDLLAFLLLDSSYYFLN